MGRIDIMVGSSDEHPWLASKYGKKIIDQRREKMQRVWKIKYENVTPHNFKNDGTSTNDDTFVNNVDDSKNDDKYSSRIISLLDRSKSAQEVVEAIEVHMIYHTICGGLLINLQSKKRGGFLSKYDNIIKLNV